MEKVSVVIVNWNVAKSLDRCLKSVFATDYSNLEVWVIDNNSSDESVEVIKSFRRAKMIKNAGNIGFPKGVNQGIRYSKGDYVVILNPDTRVPKDFFEKSLQFFVQYPQAGIMGPKLVNPSGDTQGSVFHEPSLFGENQKYTPAGPKPVAVDAISGACMFLPQSTIKKIGYLTEKVFMYYEDMDYCRRIRKSELKVYFNPQIEVIHEHGSSAKQSPTASDWRGQLWKSSLWYNGPIKHYLMWLISWFSQKLRSI